MRKFAVIDCETDPFEYEATILPFIWDYYDGKKHYTFTDAKDLINHIYDKNIIIYAHNGGKFDYHFLIDYIPPMSNILIINGRMASFKIGKAEMRDSYNILPIPLRDYQKDDFDYSILKKSRRNKGKNPQKIKEYLLHDTEYLYDLVKQYTDKYGTPITLASSAMQQARIIERFKTPKTNKTYYDMFAQYYYGGRVQFFKQGTINKKGYIVDINSAYPDAMVNKHPWGTSHTQYDDLKYVDSIERCFITVECDSNGAFPLRYKGTLYFPDDGLRRTFNITGWEYLATKKLQLLGKHTIHTVYEFDDTIDFTKYVNHFYDLKQKAKKKSADYIFAKLYLNSLYGKFGANPDKYKQYITANTTHIDWLERNEGYTFNALFGKYAIMSRPLYDDEMRYYDVTVAASITGYVRAKLLLALHAVKNPYYCDTDSIICEHYADLPLSDKLGEWDLEFIFKSGAIAGKKMYTFHGHAPDKKEYGYKSASKGVKLSPDDIIKISKGKTITYYSDAPTFSISKPPYYISRKIAI